MESRKKQLMEKVKAGSYRKDIDGLRTIAVMAVIIFHMGFLKNGYLGVDIFFAISGFLITKIVYNEAIDNRFSIVNFYLRRIRRIIPLVLFTTLIALLIGLFYMLPDDFENLCQSVFATNVFANNLLLLKTTANYWNISNEFKPLMHTWSLGVEEQFYLLYPIIFLIFNGKRSKFILPLLCVLTLVSLLLFCFSTNEAEAFYSIQYRFFELSLGGIAAIVFRNRKVSGMLTIPLVVIVLVLLVTDFNLPAGIHLFIITVASVGLLVSGGNSTKLSSVLLENKFMVGLGKISFSLYMWHQIVLAYTRYFITQDISIPLAMLLFAIVLLLSVISYYAIEQPFRDKKKVDTKKLLALSAVFFIIISGSSFYLYSIGGVVRAVPELEISKANIDWKPGSRSKHTHDAFIAYNEKIYGLDKPFADNGKLKVLIIGNSFSRDFANIILESKMGNAVDISYTYDIMTGKIMQQRIDQAKYILFIGLKKAQFEAYQDHFKIDEAKVWNIGVKNFGPSNGIFYNKAHDENYCQQRTHMNDGYFETNDSLKNQWGTHYIDMIGAVIDKNKTVPVFSNDCKFISQDGNHLTHGGAVYYSQILDLDQIFKQQ